MPEYLSSIMERLQKSADVKSVYGDPITTKGKTIIPVARVAYGFGGGGGKGIHDGKPGEGEGGGGGVVAAPVGVLEITERHTRFIAVGGSRKVIAAGLLGFCAGLLWAKRFRSLSLR